MSLVELEEAMAKVDAPAWVEDLDCILVGTVFVEQNIEQGYILLFLRAEEINDRGLIGLIVYELRTWQV